MMPPDPAALTLLKAASAARQRGQLNEERRLLDRAHAVAADSPLVQNALGMRALADERFDDAAGFFAAAAGQDAGQTALWMNLASAHRGAGYAAGEEAALERVLEIDRRHFMAHLRLAQLHERNGFTAKAIPAWRGVMQLAAAMTELPAELGKALRTGQSYLNQQNARLASALDEQFGALAEAADGTRIKACIDHTVGRRPIYSNECSGIHFPFLPAYEFFDRRLFEWIDDLESKTAEIRVEALALLESDVAAVRPYVRMERGAPPNKWSDLDHSLDWSAAFLWEFGKEDAALCARCPSTTEILRKIPQTEIAGKAPTAFFSILRPHSRIPPHTGVTNTRTIVHLPLVVPEGCGFRVGGETRQWREGEAFAFDDTIEHEAWNDSDSPRIVLIFDVWNPYLSGDERQFLRDFFDVVDAQ